MALVTPDNIKMFQVGVGVEKSSTKIAKDGKIQYSTQYQNILSEPATDSLIFQLANTNNEILLDKKPQVFQNKRIEADSTLFYQVAA